MEGVVVLKVEDDDRKIAQNMAIGDVIIGFGKLSSDTRLVANVDEFASMYDGIPDGSMFTIIVSRTNKHYKQGIDLKKGQQ